MILRLKKYTVFIFFFFLVFPLVSLSSSLEEDYDGDGINDRVQEETVDNTLHLKMWLSSIDKEKSYIIKPADEDKIPTVHQSYKKGYLELDSTYYSVQGQIYIELYKWSLEKQDWILTKIITGERPDPANDILIPSLEVTYVECCSALGSVDPYKELTESIVQKDINERLEKRISLYNSGKINEAIKDVDIYDAISYSTLLNDENLVFLNDLAFYLEKENPTASALILEKIITKYPNRMVAKLNLADAYWAILEGNSPKIKQLYQEYKEAMIQKGLAKKIPTRVFERTK